MTTAYHKNPNTMLTKTPHNETYDSQSLQLTHLHQLNQLYDH